MLIIAFSALVLFRNVNLHTKEIARVSVICHISQYQQETTLQRGTCGLY